MHVEVLAVALNYLPEAVLWLVTTPLQARLMRDTQPRAVVFTLGEAADLATSLGDTRPPTSLWQVAVEFSTPAPSSPEDPPEEWEDPGRYRSGALRLLTTPFTPSTDWLTRSASSFSARDVTGPVRMTVPSCERTCTLWSGSARVE